MNRIKEWNTLLPSFRGDLKGIGIAIIVILFVIIVMAKDWTF